MGEGWGEGLLLSVGPACSRPLCVDCGCHKKNLVPCFDPIGQSRSWGISRNLLSPSGESRAPDGSTEEESKTEVWKPSTPEEERKGREEGKKEEEKQDPHPGPLPQVGEGGRVFKSFLVHLRHMFCASTPYVLCNGCGTRHAFTDVALVGYKDTTAPKTASSGTR